MVHFTGADVSFKNVFIICSFFFVFQLKSLEVQVSEVHGWVDLVSARLRWHHRYPLPERALVPCRNCLRELQLPVPGPVPVLLLLSLCICMFSCLGQVEPCHSCLSCPPFSPQHCVTAFP